jgi:hypothetical protein
MGWRHIFGVAAAKAISDMHQRISRKEPPHRSILTVVVHKLLIEFMGQSLAVLIRIPVGCHRRSVCRVCELSIRLGD